MFAKKAGAISISNLLANLFSSLNFIIIARLFTQESIGIYSVYMASSAIIVVFLYSSGHMSIPNIENNTHLSTAVLFLITWTILVSFFCFIILSFSSYRFGFLLSITVLANGLRQIFDQLNTRFEDYKYLSISRVAAPLMFFALFFSFFQIDTSTFTLVASQAAAVLLTALVYSYMSLKRQKFFPRLLSKPVSPAILLREHRKMLLYVGPSQIFNILAYQLPVIAIERFFGAVVAAQYSLSLRLCQQPVNIIGQGIAQAYHGKLASWRRAGKTDFYGHYRKLSFFLMFLGLLTLAGVVLIYPVLIRILLGETWDLSVRISQAMSPAFGAMIAVMPLSLTFIVFNDEAYVLFNQAWGFINSIIGFSVAILTNNIILGVFIFSALTTFRYAIIWIKLNKIHKKMGSC